MKHFVLICTVFCVLPFFHFFHFSKSLRPGMSFRCPFQRVFIHKFSGYLIMDKAAFCSKIGVSYSNVLQPWCFQRYIVVPFGEGWQQDEKIFFNTSGLQDNNQFKQCILMSNVCINEKQQWQKYRRTKIT